ncbi:MAG TPA: cytochrome c oxidase assembly protein [Pseudonocardiaceae bacterium]|nr:cytochrome c oxidase assembly protein [Pseudonocardiaceae bacterium]
MTATLAGYPHLPPLDLTTVFTGWSADLPTIVFVVLLGFGYVAAVHRYASTTGTPWPRSRNVAFFGGLALIALMGVSFFGTYADTLFWVRAAEVITLLMVVPLCLALSSPVALALATLPVRGQERLRAVQASRFARVLTFPATASLLLVATPWALYFTGWYPAVLTDSVVDHLTRLALLLVGFLYFYSRLQLDPVPHKYPHMISVVITFVEVIFDAALGLVLWLNPHIVAEAYYQGVGRGWGPTSRDDQIFGAGVLWLVGDLAGLPFLGALMKRMAHDDAVEATEIDKQLDEQDAVDAALPPDPETGRPTKSRLWWEDDPQLADRFRRGQG